MSAIDRYHHTYLGIVTCPSRFPIVSGNSTTRLVAIYRLDEDALDDDSCSGKRGDILLGGGRGEASALRISLPEAPYFFTHSDWERFPDSDGWTPRILLCAYWGMTQAYVFGDGYAALGWRPDTPIELWLTHHVLSFLTRHYPDEFAGYLGSEPLEEDGSICRLPTPDQVPSGSVTDSGTSS